MISHEGFGVVGLGKMGGAMARRLIDEGWTVVGYDPDEDALSSAADYGVTPAESPASVASRSDIALTSLPTPAAVEAAYLGEEGLAAGADGDLVALEMSTIDPGTTETVATGARGLTLLDAPVSGGPEKSRNGTLTLMVGGDREAFESDLVRAAFDSLAENVYHLGGVGAGHTTKLLNNQIGATTRAVSLEAAAVAAARGVDWEAFMQVVRRSSGSSYQFRKRMPRVLNRDFEPGFAAEMTRKDLRLALEMADAVDAQSPITSVVHDLYERADAEGLGGQDSAAIVKLFEESTGVPVESDRRFDEDFLDWRDV